MGTNRTARTHLLLRRRIAGALAGLVAGAAAVAASEAVAALQTGVTSPLLAVANRAVDTAPRPVKEWAIETFGSADKAVLVAGVVTTVAALVVLAGALGATRSRIGVGLFASLSAVAAAAVLTDRAATAGPVERLLPVAALVLAGPVALALLLRPLRSRPPEQVPGSGECGGLSGAWAPPPGRRVRSAGSTSDLGGLPGDILRDDLAADFDRRSFLRAVTAVGVVAVAGGAVARAYGGPDAAAARAGLAVPAPSSPAPALAGDMTLDVPGITPYLTSNKDFYRVDTALRVPDVPVDTWRLRVHGMVGRELDLSFEDLLSRRLVERRITMTCVSNPVGGEYAGNATWIGVPVRDLLREAGVEPGADAVRSTSADDFTAGTPLEVLDDDGRDAILAVAMNGEPLPLEHGFPVRMVTPGLYGYVSATKWLVDLEVTRFADFEAYWTTRGYAARAPIKTSSRIDVPRSFARVKPGRTPVAGVAWSQDRGVRAVEVRVDEGPWQEARLAEEDNVDTWRQWVWDWEAAPGNHVLEVRATDATGATQTPERSPIAPDGATGWHKVNVTVTG